MIGTYANRWSLGVCILCAAAVVLLNLPRTTAEDQVTFLDGKKITATITAIDAEGRLNGTGTDEPVDLQGIRRLIRTVTAEPTSQPQSELHLLGGGVIRCTSLAMTDEQFTLKWKYGELQIPLEAARAGKLSGHGNQGHPADTLQGRQILASAIAGDDDKDHLLMIVDGKVQDLAGLLVECDGKQFGFEWNGRTRQVAAANVYGVVLAEIGEPHDSMGECTIRLRDGSAVTGRVQHLTAGKLNIRIYDDLTIDLPWDEVTSIDVRSDRMLFLSDMKPLEAQHTPVVTLKRPWQADRNVTGGTLTIGEQTFEKGIGVQSLSKLVFAVDRRFDTLASTIGIDRSAKGRGDCEFVILGDGKELWRQRVRGTDEAREIRVKTKNVSRITLLVNPGENLDLSDYANWCDVRLLRSEADNERSD